MRVSLPGRNGDLTMEIILSILFILGAMCIGLGAFLIHIGKSVGAGLVTFGIIMVGISSGIVKLGS